MPNQDTGSFSRGRGRVPLKFLTAVNSRISDHLSARIQPEDTYELMSTLDERQVHTLIRLHQARYRVLDRRRGKKIDNHQRLVTWKRPSQKPSGSTLTSDEWAALPDEMEVRLIRFYFEDRDGKKRRMVLATTLTDHEKYDWQDLAAIYAQRWDIELRLRDVKTTLEMDHLWVKTPETARKSLRMDLIVPRAEYKESPHRGKSRASALNSAIRVSQNILTFHC